MDIRRFPHSRHNPDVEGDALNNWVPDAGIGYRKEPRRNVLGCSTGTPPYSNLPYLQVVRAFDPSGVQVNSAESDSAVRCMHGQFESSHRQVSSLLVRRGIRRSR